MFLAQLQELQNLLSDQQKQPNRHIFNTRFEGLLCEIWDGTLATFLSSDIYHKIKTSMWMSFYACYLHPYKMPQDREIITTWLRGFHLAEISDAETFANTARSIRKVRPTVPFPWFEDSSHSPDRGSGHRDAEDNLLNKKANLIDRITAYKKLRSDLNGLFIKKYTEYLAKPVRESIPRSNDETRFVEGAVGIGLDDPARLTTHDLQTVGNSFNLLRNVGQNPELYSIPDLINALDVQIAMATVDLDATNTSNSIMLLGRTFVEINEFVTPKKDEMVRKEEDRT
jgi:hypothetical protein